MLFMSNLHSRMASRCCCSKVPSPTSWAGAPLDLHCFFFVVNLEKLKICPPAVVLLNDPGLVTIIVWEMAAWNNPQAMIHSRLLVGDRQTSNCCGQWFQPRFETPCSRQKVALNIPARDSSHRRNHFSLEFLPTGTSRQSCKTNLAEMIFYIQNRSKK